MALNIDNFDAVLKQHYTRERIIDMVYPDHALLALMPKFTGFGGRNLPIVVTYGHPQGRSATFATAQANKGNSSTVDFVLTRKKDYSIVSIDGETIEASRGDANAFLEAVTFEIDNGIESLRRSMGTAIYRNGSGALGQVGSMTNKVLTLKNIKDVVNFEVGMEICAADNETSGSLHDSGDAITLTAIDRDLGTLTSDENWSEISGIGNDDYLFVDGDRNSKMSGVLAWIPTTAPDSTSFYGVDRSVEVVRLGGVRYDGSDDTIDEALVKGASKGAKNGGKMSHCFISHDDYLRLELQLGPKVRYTDIEVPDTQIGFRGISLSYPGGMMKVIPDIDCPDGRAFALDLDTWKLNSLGDAPHVLMHDGKRTQREASSDGIEVRVGFYGNVGCKAPGHNVNITLPSA